MTVSRWITLALTLTVALTFGTGAQATEDASKGRWQKDEKPYAEMNVPEKIGSNVRRGLLGLVDNLVQGAFSGAAILSPYGGYTIQKIATVVGDVVGLVDDNPVTEHVFQGILSRQFLRFGSGAAGLPRRLSRIHDTAFEKEMLPPEEYVGHRMFHTQAYVKHSALASLGAVIVSDILIRPAGNLITIFGGRGTGEKLNELGIDLIDRSLDVSFF